VTITAWRIFKSQHEVSAFTGEGARLYGGRWNSHGTAIVYTAGTASLAVLELLVHIASPKVLDAYSLCEVTFADTLVETIGIRDLPSNWSADPAPWELKRLGDSWATQNTSAVLQVPSAIVESEVNFLLNPAHADFSSIRIGPARPHRFDPRLMR
jgi:RES domain-containing protein